MLTIKHSILTIALAFTATTLCAQTTEKKPSAEADKKPAVEKGFEVGNALPDEIGHTMKYADGFLHVRIVENNLQIYFLNSDNLIIEPEVQKVRVIAEKARNRTNEIFFLAKPKPGKPYLTSPRFLGPPADYWINILVFDPEDDEKTTSIEIFRLRQ